MLGRRVRVRIGEIEHTGRGTVIESRVYATPPSNTLAFRERSRYHIMRLEV